MNLSYLKKKVQFTFPKILKTSSTVQVKVRLGRFQLNGGINHRDIVPQTKEVVLHPWRLDARLHRFSSSSLIVTSFASYQLVSLTSIKLNYFVIQRIGKKYYKAGVVLLE